MKKLLFLAIISISSFAQINIDFGYNWDNRQDTCNSRITIKKNKYINQIYDKDISLPEILTQAYAPHKQAINDIRNANKNRNKKQTVNEFVSQFQNLPNTMNIASELESFVEVDKNKVRSFLCKLVNAIENCKAELFTVKKPMDHRSAANYACKGKVAKKLKAIIKSA
jgi:predicted DNA-binding protein YlxM (UPF0122 family)